MPPPPGWYGDIYGNSPRWWDGTIWTEHVMPVQPEPEPVPELSAFENFTITVSLWPDWLKVAAVAAIVAIAILIAMQFVGGDSANNGGTEFIPTDPTLPQDPGSITPDSGAGTLPG